MVNTHLNRAKKEKNDEFYTSYKDIEDELQYYQEVFKGKVVYCNCDRPCDSEFWNYFEDNFNLLGLKKLVATYFDKSRSVWKTEIISATDDTRTVLRTKISGNGSFQSEEYPELDNFRAININRIKDIPCDYFDVMAVPISFMKWFNPKQFELLGITRHYDSFAKKIFIEGGKRTFDPVLNGRHIYNRIFVKRIANHQSAECFSAKMTKS